jgi:hypothetical protein
LDCIEIFEGFGERELDCKYYIAIETRDSIDYTVVAGRMD